MSGAALSPAAVLRSVVAACLAAERLPLAWAVENTRVDGADPVAVAWLTCADPAPMMTLARWVTGAAVERPPGCAGRHETIYGGALRSLDEYVPAHHWREKRRMGPCLDCARACRRAVPVLTVDSLHRGTPTLAAEIADAAQHRAQIKSWVQTMAALNGAVAGDALALTTAEV